MNVLGNVFIVIDYYKDILLLWSILKVLMKIFFLNFEKGVNEFMIGYNIIW